MLKIPVNNFSVMSGWSQRFLGIYQCSGDLMCLAQEHKMVQPVGIEPRTSKFGIRCSTTTPHNDEVIKIIRTLWQLPHPLGYSVTINEKSHIMRKPIFCLCENKGADQLRSNCEADQRLCFRYSDSTISLLLKSEISSF